MPDEELIQRVVNTTRQLAAEDPRGEVEGKDVAEKLGMDPGDVALYDAFKVAERRGRLTCGSWPGSMDLPGMVRVD